MSYFGRNIKKIRSAKNISQTAFAEMFGLTRASIGAYEEGRAEAKLDTIIEIADYFNLSLEQLLKKELTINDIYRIREISSRLHSSEVDAFSEADIPFVQKTEYQFFIKKYNNNTFLQGLPHIKFPGIIANSIVFEYGEEMGFFEELALRKGDLLFAYQIQEDEKPGNIENSLFIILSAKNLSLLYRKHDHFDKSEDTKSEWSGIFNNQLPNIKAVWKVYQVLGSKNPTSRGFEAWMLKMEQRINELINLHGNSIESQKSGDNK